MRPPETETTEALQEEQRRIRYLRMMVDLSAAVIRQRPLSRPEGELVVARLREEVLALFPDKETVFDLIYRPRFRRLIDECCDSSGQGRSAATGRGYQP